MGFCWRQEEEMTRDNKKSCRAMKMCLLILPLFLASCSTSYSVLVIDADTKEPIPNAMVYSDKPSMVPFVFSNANWISITDEDGIADGVEPNFMVGCEGYYMASGFSAKHINIRFYSVELSKNKPDYDEYFRINMIGFRGTKKTLLDKADSDPVWKRFYQYVETQKPEWYFYGPSAMREKKNK